MDGTTADLRPRVRFKESVEEIYVSANVDFNITGSASIALLVKVIRLWIWLFILIPVYVVEGYMRVARWMSRKIGRGLVRLGGG